MKKMIVLGLLIIILILLIIKGVNMKKSALPQGFPNMISSYQFIERELVLSDFDQFEIGSDYGNIIRILGEPNGYWGSGVSMPYYQLTDGSCVTIYGGEHIGIIKIEVTDIDGNTTVFKA